MGNDELAKKISWREQRAHMGALGEALARKYLKQKGFAIRESNYRKQWGEVDVIAERNRKIHFVEVKAIAQKRGGGANSYRPEENVHPQKLKRLFATVYSYLEEREKGGNVAWQLDVIAVEINEAARLAKVRVLEDVTL